MAAVVRVPYDPDLRARGLRDAARLGSRSVQAAELLVQAVVASARESWGDPLPVAAQPAPVVPIPSRVHPEEKVLLP